MAEIQKEEVELPVLYHHVANNFNIHGSSLFSVWLYTFFTCAKSMHNLLDIWGCQAIAILSTKQLLAILGSFYWLLSVNEAVVTQAVIKYIRLFP